MSWSIYLTYYIGCGRAVWGSEFPNCSPVRLGVARPTASFPLLHASSEFGSEELFNAEPLQPYSSSGGAGGVDSEHIMSISESSNPAHSSQMDSYRNFTVICVYGRQFSANNSGTLGPVLMNFCFLGPHFHVIDQYGIKFWKSAPWVSKFPEKKSKIFRFLPLSPDLDVARKKIHIRNILNQGPD